MGLETGDKAPDFSLCDRRGKAHRLSDLRGRTVVLYFYPKDDTPGCTIEAVEFNALLDRFKKLGAEIVGVSGGDDRSKSKFCEKHDLEVTLLSDSDFEVSKRYGAYGEKSFMGRKFKGILRTTFVLSANREVIKRFDNVKAKNHAEAVLEFLREEEDSTAGSKRSESATGKRKPQTASKRKAASDPRKRTR